MDEVMNEIYALVTLNAEAETHAEDLFEQLKDKILTHNIDRDGFEKHAPDIKSAICIGKNYTETLNNEVVNFERVSVLYEIGKQSKKLRKTAKNSEGKVLWRNIMKVRENILDKAGSMYRRWLLKLFPVEAVNAAVSAEVAVAVSQSAAARDIETLDHNLILDQLKLKGADQITSLSLIHLPLLPTYLLLSTIAGVTSVSSCRPRGLSQVTAKVP
jgi:hypothetical protein